MLQLNDPGPHFPVSLMRLFHLGCPDQFLVYRRSHMFDGVPRENFTTLTGCQQECLVTRHCLGIDWLTRPTATDTIRCFLVFPESTQLGLSPFPLDTSDHYRRTFCKPGNVTSAGQNSLLLLQVANTFKLVNCMLCLKQSITIKHIISQKFEKHY